MPKSKAVLYAEMQDRYQDCCTTTVASYPTSLHRFTSYSTDEAVMYAPLPSLKFDDQWKCIYCGTVTAWHFQSDDPRPKKCWSCGAPRK